MSSWFRALFFIGALYSSRLQAMSSTPVALAEFLASEQAASIRDQFKKFNPRNIPIAPIVLELARQREARHAVRENAMPRAFAVVGAAFTGVKWFSRMFLSGVVLMKDGLSLIANFFAKDASVGVFAMATAGGFMYLRHQVGQVRETQKDHTLRLGTLQTASSTIISTQATHGQQLTGLQASVQELNEGQERLDEGIKAAQTLLSQLSEKVDQNNVTLQGVSASVQDVVTRLNNVEQGIDTLNSGLAGLQTSVNASNATLNQRFAGFETTFSGLSSRVDDGVSKVEQLRLLLQESVSGLRTLVGENAGNVNGTIQELQGELTRLTGVLDEKALAMQQSVEQLDVNAQARHHELRGEMQRSVSGLHGKLDQLLEASRSQPPTLSWQPERRQQGPLSVFLLQRNDDQRRPASFALPGSFSGELTSGFGSTRSSEQLFLTDKTNK